jgi:adenylate cyclase
LGARSSPESQLGHHWRVESEDGQVTPADRVATAYRLAQLEAPTLRRRDVAEGTGVAPEQSVRWWRALGFAAVDEDDLAFREADVEVVRELGILVESGVVDDADVLRLARLMSSLFSRLVEAQLDVLELGVGADDEPSTDPERRLEELAAADVDIFAFMEKTMAYVWRRHLLGAIGHRLSVDNTEQGQAVAFADLSGFARFTKRATAEEIASVIDTFEAVAFDVVSAHEGRVVKLIGDEVLFVVDSLDDAVAAGLELIERLEHADGMPPVHCGIAFGPTITVGGDVFGPTVNLASRLTKVARAGSISVSRSGSGHLLERKDIDVRKVRRSYDLKGIGRTSILAVRALPDTGQDDAGAADLGLDAVPI